MAKGPVKLKIGHSFRQSLIVKFVSFYHFNLAYEVIYMTVKEF